MRETRKDVVHPCIGCKYFKACGETTRTQPCEGRELRPRKRSVFGLIGKRGAKNDSR